MVTSLSLPRHEACASCSVAGVLERVLNVFTAHRSEKLITYGNSYLPVQTLCLTFSPPSPLHAALFQRSFFSEQVTKKFTNTYDPLTSSAARLTANIHPLNGTCHGSACPLTKDNCDLDKHWGGGHKGKGQVLFQFKCAPIHLQHNGHKELQLPPFLKGMWLPVLPRRRKMLILNLIRVREKKKEEEEHLAEISRRFFGLLKGEPLPLPPHLLSKHPQKGRDITAWIPDTQ